MNPASLFRFLPDTAMTTRSLGAALLSALAFSISPAAAPAQQPGSAAPAPIPANATLDPAVFAPPARSTVPAEGTTVPLRSAARPVVEVRVNGRGPFRMLVETLGGPTELSRETAQRLGLDVRAAGTNLPVARVDSVRIGSALLEGVAVVVPEALAPGADGILGLGAFRDLLLTLDFPAMELRLSRGALGAPDGRERLRLVGAGRLWGVGEVSGVEVMVAGRREVAVLNAQSPAGVGAVPARAEGLPLAAAPVVVGRVRGPVLGEVEHRAARLAGDVRLGAHVLQRPIVSIVPAPSRLPQAFSLGSGVLRAFAITWDQRGGVVRLSRADTAPLPPTPPIRSFGFATGRAQPGMEVVTDVAPGTEAARAGVRAGDELAVVDGRPAMTLDGAAWRALMAEERPVLFRFRREGADRDVYLLPATLVR